MHGRSFRGSVYKPPCTRTAIHSLTKAAFDTQNVAEMLTFAPMHPKFLSIHDFTYDLPAARIATHPVSPRDSAKLLVYRKGEISEDQFRDLHKFLPDDAVIVFNNTRVIKSRLLFKKATGAVIEIFCLEPASSDGHHEHALNQQAAVAWRCLIGKAGKWKEKQLSKTVTIGGTEVRLTAELTGKEPDAYVVGFSWTPAHFTFGEVLEAAGVTPLPPYIKRIAEKQDEIDYQTVYAGPEGSVAAPTAGLHFTPRMLEELQRQNTPTLFTTLHVGAGTFKPVKAATMEGHHMHAEWIHITTDRLKELLAHSGRPVIAVGTTATRTLETLYWMGNKILNRPGLQPEELKITQWEVYSPPKHHPVAQSLEALLRWMEEKGINHLSVETEIIIAPGYQFKMISGLITNFHQPESTLLLLVAALAGENWKAIYEYALQHDFRFLSYGDGCLILP